MLGRELPASRRAIADCVVPIRLATSCWVSPALTRAAIKVFRKRLRYARLDAESRLGVGPMSSGKRNDIDAIEAPREYPMPVWRALVAAGRLRSVGGGFFALAVDDLNDD
jgi:hypothetical protein